MEQVFNLRILGEKYLDPQKELYHVFIDFKKAFDGVWHDDTMIKYDINHNLIDVIRQLYQKANSDVYYNCSIGDWLNTTLGVQQIPFVSNTLHNFLRKNHDKRSCRHCQYWRKNKHQPEVC